MNYNYELINIKIKYSSCDQNTIARANKKFKLLVYTLCFKYVVNINSNNNNRNNNKHM